MDLAVIDTLKFADHLKTAGFSPRQAEGLARALGDELGERMVVKRDLDDAVQAMNRNLDDAVQAMNRNLDDAVQAMNRNLDDAVQAINSTIVALNAKFESRFEAMDQRFEAMDQRFEAMDQKFVAMDQKFESKFQALEPRFDAIDAKLESQHRESSTRFNVLFGAMALGFTLITGLIGYSLFSPQPVAPASPAEEHRATDAPASRLSEIRPHELS